MDEEEMNASNSNKPSGKWHVAVFVAAVLGIFVGIIVVASDKASAIKKCSEPGCTLQAVSYSIYCREHYMSNNRNSMEEASTTARTQQSSTAATKATKSSSGTTKSGISSSGSGSKKNKGSSKSNSKGNPYKSYDEGYEAIYEDDDYDWNRYKTDRDYADGVDDAMDELDW